MISLCSSMSHTSGYCDAIALNIASVQDIRLRPRCSSRGIPQNSKNSGVTRTFGTHYATYNSSIEGLTRITHQSYDSEMKIIPAVDIKDGKCTQLVGGRPGTEKFYGNPVEVAEQWALMGAEILHVIDLDAALGTGNNFNEIIKIRKSIDLPIQVGGGIRTYRDAKKLLGAGIDRIIAGTFAVNDYFNDFENLKELNDEFGNERVIVAVDSKNGKVVIRGWQEKTDLFAHEFIKNFEELAWGFLYTDVDVEGQMKGINLAGIERVVSAAGLPVIVSGGITTAEDIKNIRGIGAWGVVIGKALYEGKIKFEDLI